MIQQNVHMSFYRKRSRCKIGIWVHDTPATSSGSFRNIWRASSKPLKCELVKWMRVCRFALQVPAKPHKCGFEAIEKPLRGIASQAHSLRGVLRKEHPFSVCHIFLFSRQRNGTFAGTLPICVMYIEQQKNSFSYPNATPSAYSLHHQNWKIWTHLYIALLRYIIRARRWWTRCLICIVLRFSLQRLWLDIETLGC